MRKLSLLLAAALMVSLPLVTAMTTDTFAAAKAKKAAKAAPAPKETGPQAPFQSMHNALDDLGKQLATYRYDPNAAPAKGAPAKGGKKK